MANVKQFWQNGRFLSEQDLENFVWKALLQLLGLEPLARQYSVDKLHRCDILGVTSERQLAIIELKAVIDAGVVAQLTRYYHALTHQKPFQAEVDYEKPILLIAIGPEFHTNSVVEAKYSTLSFRFLKYVLFERQNQLYFGLNQEGDSCRVEHPISADLSFDSSLPAVPPALAKMLTPASQTVAQALIGARAKILASNHRIKETAAAAVWTYARGKTFAIAEIRTDRRHECALYLYLPLVKPRGRQTPACIKARVWLQGLSVTHIGFLLTKNMQPITDEEWIEQKFKLVGEAKVVKSWMRCGLIVDPEHELNNPAIRRVMLEKYNWGQCEWGLALSIEQYCQHLARYSLTDRIEDCRMLDGLIDLALHHLDKRKP